MMRFATALLTTLFILHSACFATIPEAKLPGKSTIAKAGKLKAGPFAGIDPAKVPESTAALILAANIDFVNILKDKKPVFAVKKGGPFLDGGTQVYHGIGYKIISYSSITRIAQLDGFTVGVKVVFEERLAPGNVNEFSQTRFKKTNH